MLKIIRNILLKFIDDIDADNTHLNYELQCSIIQILTNVDKLLELYKIQLDNNVGYDYVFVANMCKADYYGSSITDDKHVALYIKDTIDDEDAADGTTMRRWYATMVANGILVDWDDSL